MTRADLSVGPDELEPFGYFELRQLHLQALAAESEDAWLHQLAAGLQSGSGQIILAD